MIISNLGRPRKVYMSPRAPPLVLACRLKGAAVIFQSNRPPMSHLNDTGFS